MSIERRPLAIGEVIVENDDKRQRYTIKSILGQGGTGITYQVNDAVGNAYCLKELFPTELTDSLIRTEYGKITLNPIFGNKHESVWAWYHDNLMQEEQMQRKIAINAKSKANDPYFLKSYGTFRAENGNLYTKYELEDGTALSQVIDSFSVSELIKILITAAKKIDILHIIKRYLHLDLSPANIYVIQHASDKEAYFLDFGNAISLDDPNGASKHRYSTTEGYSAPEVRAKAEGNGSSIYEVGEYSDTYSLAAILFRALVGDVFSADYRLEPHLWMSKVHVKLGKYGAEKATEQIIEILRRGLSEKESRYQSASELLNDLCTAYNAITGNNAEIDKLIKDIEIRITDFEQAISQKLDTKSEEINAHTEKESKKTRNHISKIAVGFAACFVAVIGLALVFVLSDFKAPKIMPQACAKTDQGYEVYGDYFECLLQITDNKELASYNITINDLIFDGFDCTPSLKSVDDGCYQLILGGISKTSDSAQIIIQAGCAQDTAKNHSVETHIPLVFIDKKGDVTPPSIIISKPASAQKQYLVPLGGELTYWVSMNDETELSKENVSEEYVHAADFQYDELITSYEHGMHKITFVNVRGNEGECHVYFSPGLAIDTNNNYSKGVEAKFYLYSDEKNIDTSDPEIKISTLSASNGVLEYQVEVTDNMSIQSFGLSENDITMVGFSANIQIEYVPTFSNKHSVRTIRFTNIKSTSDSPDKFFIVNSGIATDSFSNQTKAVISPYLTIPN